MRILLEKRPQKREVYIHYHNFSSLHGSTATLGIVFSPVTGRFFHIDI